VTASFNSYRSTCHGIINCRSIGHIQADKAASLFAELLNMIGFYLWIQSMAMFKPDKTPRLNVIDWIHKNQSCLIVRRVG